jgi:hypothetical protein
MREAQWVQHFSGKGKKWQVSLENGSTWHISSENGPLYLNKSEYILCDPPSATRKKPSGNQPTQWVRLKGGDGTAYRVQESRLWPTAGNAIAVGNPADSSLLFILPKDACEPCDQPEKWEDVTG